VEIATKYAGYIGKQAEDVARAAHLEHLKLPAELDYARVKALSFEVRQKLGRYRPETLGLASRISGVTPAAISLLLVHLKKGRFKGFADGLGLKQVPPRAAARATTDVAGEGAPAQDAG
jgi:tRNA uridine 5-carboxymethylaminomethyl modification enzyme